MAGTARSEVRLLCNDFGNRIPYSDYVEAISQTRLPLKVPGAIPNLQASE